MRASPARGKTSHAMTIHHPRSFRLRAAAPLVFTLAACASSSPAAAPSCRPQPGTYDVTFTAEVDAVTHAPTDCPPRDPTTWTLDANGNAGPDVAPPLGNGTAVFVKYPDHPDPTLAANHCDLRIHGEEASALCAPSTAKLDALVTFTETGTAAGPFIVYECTDHAVESCTYDVTAIRRATP